MLAGRGFGLTAPLHGHSPMHYAEIEAAQGSTLELPVDLGQRAAYLASGSVVCGDRSCEPGQLLVFADDAIIRLEFAADTHLMLLGGQRLPEDRYIWWNFVATTASAIEAAKRRWGAGEFPPVPGDTGHMEMPAS
jgi:hypothetical protein